MLKSADKKATAAPQRHACYEESAQPSLGITFCRKDGVQRFVPFSFLSNVDFDGNGELIFHFTTWSATVRGENLQPLWKAVRDGCLTEVRELDRAPDATAPWVREIVFADSNADAETSFTGPAFPDHCDPPLRRRGRAATLRHDESA